jgi:hypothetical protein
LEQVEAAAAAVLGSAVGREAPLMSAGMDSLGAVEFRNSLEGKLGLQLPSTLVFDYPTVAAIVDYVAEAEAPQEDEQPPAAGEAAAGPPARALAEAGGRKVVAVVSAAARRWPAGAGGFLVSDVIRAVPQARWDVERRLTEDMPARFGGFIANVEVGVVAPAWCAC